MKVHYDEEVDALYIKLGYIGHIIQYRVSFHMQTTIT